MISYLVEIIYDFLIKMFSSDELEDSIDDVVFFGPVSDKELKIANKLSNRRTENFSFYKKASVDNEKMGDSSTDTVPETDLGVSYREKISESPVEVRQARESPLSHVTSVQVESPADITYAHNKATPALNIPSKRSSLEATNAEPLSEDISISLEVAIQDINNLHITCDNSLPEDLHNIILTSIEEACISKEGEKSGLLCNDPNVSERSTIQQDKPEFQQALSGYEDKILNCHFEDNFNDNHISKLNFPNLEHFLQQSVISKEHNCDINASSDMNISCISNPDNCKEEAGIIDISPKYLRNDSHTESNDMPDNCPANTAKMLSFSRELPNEQTDQGQFNPKPNVLLSESLNYEKAGNVEHATQNYFETLELIDISSECDDISEGNNSHEINESLAVDSSSLGFNNESSYISDGSQNCAIILSKHEEYEQKVHEQPSVQNARDTSTVNLESDRIFNDTIEEMELLLKYGAEYFQEDNITVSPEHREFATVPKITLNYDSICSPRKESVSSINSALFIPPCNSTRRINDNQKSVENTATFIVGTHKKSQANRAPPAKPPRKGKSPLLLQQTNGEPSIKSSKNERTPNKRKCIPTYKLMPKARSPRTPYNTPCLKIRPAGVSPLSKPRQRPTSSISLFKPKSRLTPLIQPRAFLTPQAKYENYTPRRGSKSPISCESEALHKKIRGLSIVSPVARYLQNNPPPPLITTVKPKNKMDPKFIEKVLSPSLITVLQDSNKNPSGKSPNIPIERKILLPSYSYTTSKTQILEKENINTRREILTNNPPTSITRHIGRFKVPKQVEDTARSPIDQSMMEVSVCENKLVKHSHTLH